MKYYLFLFPLLLAACQVPSGQCEYYDVCEEPEADHVFGSGGRDVFGNETGGNVWGRGGGE